MSQRKAFILSAENRPILRWLGKTYVRPYFWRLVAAACFMAVTAAAAAALAWLAGPAVDDIFGDGGSSFGRLVPFLVIGVVLVNGVAMYFQSIIIQSVGQQIIAKLQLDLFRHFTESDAAFRNKMHNGQLLSRCMSDTGAVQGAVSGTILAVARDILMFIFLFGVMVSRDPVLSVVAFVVMPLMLWGVGRIGVRTRKLHEQMLQNNGDLTAAITESLDGQRLVKVYGAEQREYERVARVIGTRLDLQRRLSRVRALTSPVTEVLGGLAIAAAMFYGAHQAATSNLTFGDYSSFLAALIFAYRPLKRLAAVNVSMQAGMAAGHRLMTAFAMKPMVVDRPDAKPLQLAGGEIRFESVTFAYDEGKPVLDDIRLAVPAGRAVALVGVSGAGKSTLLNLIPRLYDMRFGRVLVDGQDIREVTLASLRAAISVVTQETILFDDSVRANIAYGRPEASEADILAAARAAAALEFIQALPNGLDTIIGQRGIRLSGGQRQRIAIARAMLKDAPILLLDEATSSLDNEAEQQVKVALQRLMKGRTTLIVAHRLSTVIDADEIHVMEKGRIVESGSHAQLLRQGGRYAELYQTQLPQSDAA
ncbi:MAG TPA: ABC transporter transmembrane domain-containing protein [Kiloniellales bacterium]|nr:ABC transporter transmembrane domain-containing protein [Kiloniellales bacterium]